MTALTQCYIVRARLEDRIHELEAQLAEARRDIEQYQTTLQEEYDKREALDDKLAELKEDYQLVPVEPTEEILDLLSRYEDAAEQVYKAMLSAAKGE